MYTSHFIIFWLSYYTNLKHNIPCQRYSANDRAWSFHQKYLQNHVSTKCTHITLLSCKFSIQNYSPMLEAFSRGLQWATWVSGEALQTSLWKLCKLTAALHLGSLPCIPSLNICISSQWMEDMRHKYRKHSTVFLLNSKLSQILLYTSMFF